MTSSEVWGAETAARYDAEDQGMFAPEVLGPTVDLLAELAGLALDERYADWDRSPFTDDSTSTCRSGGSPDHNQRRYTSSRPG